MYFYAQAPRKIRISYRYAPGSTYPRGIQSIPVRSVAGGEGWVRGKIHRSLVNLWVVMAWLRVAGGGGSAVEQRWRRRKHDSGKLRRARAGAAGSVRFTGGRGRRDEARLGQCGGGDGSSAWSRASPAMVEAAERWRRKCRSRGGRTG